MTYGRGSKLFSGLDHKFAHLRCDVLLADTVTCRFEDQLELSRELQRPHHL